MSIISMPPFTISIHALREEGDIRCFMLSLSITISIHALREEGDHSAPILYVRIAGFLSTPSARRATRENALLHLLMEFLSTPSARRATPIAHAHHLIPSDFYPRPPRGGRHAGFSYPQTGMEISIHALREEGDPNRLHRWRVWVISIHALREEGDICCKLLIGSQNNFYPRPPRGGRHRYLSGLSPDRNFYPRPPRGGRHLSFAPVSWMSYFYPRPPRGGRQRRRCCRSQQPEFLSTPSARRATPTRSSVPSGAR